MCFLLCRVEAPDLYGGWRRGDLLQSGGDSGACARGGDTSVRASARLNAAAHHSAEKVAAGEKNSGLRAPTFSAARPGVLKDPAPQGGAVTVGYVAAPGPLLCTPLLADTAADTVDVKYLLHAALQGEEGGEEARGDCVACRADGAQDPATQDHGVLG